MMLSAALVSTASCTAVGPGTDGQEQSESGSCIVLYCSRTGNTERMAQTISTALGCDMIEVVPETPYEDDYNAMLDRASAELAAIEQGDYPAVATSVENFDTYDIVFVGYPIWYGHMATPMQAFLHEHADLLAGKRIALFASSGSSDIGTSERDAASLAPDAVFTESLLLTSSSLNSMESLVSVWLDEMQISDNQTNADMENNKIRLTVEGGRTFTATLVDNTSAQALVEQLAKGDITVDMEDYADMEKVGTLGRRPDSVSGQLVCHLLRYEFMELYPLGKDRQYLADRTEGCIGRRRCESDALAGALILADCSAGMEALPVFRRSDAF